MNIMNTQIRELTLEETNTVVGGSWGTVARFLRRTAAGEIVVQGFYAGMESGAAWLSHQANRVRWVIISASGGN